MSKHAVTCKANSGIVRLQRALVLLRFHMTMPDFSGILLRSENHFKAWGFQAGSCYCWENILREGCPCALPLSTTSTHIVRWLTSVAIYYLLILQRTSAYSHQMDCWKAPSICQRTVILSLECLSGVAVVPLRDEGCILAFLPSLQPIREGWAAPVLYHTAVPVKLIILGARTTLPPENEVTRKKWKVRL